MRHNNVSTTTTNIMTTDHPMWNRFFARLVAQLDFRNSSSGNTVFRCDNTHDKATEILKDIGGVNIPETLDYFKDNGGHCDCEIVFNVPASREWADHEAEKE